MLTFNFADSSDHGSKIQGSAKDVSSEFLAEKYRDYKWTQKCLLFYTSVALTHVKLTKLTNNFTFVTLKPLYVILNGKQNLFKKKW